MSKIIADEYSLYEFDAVHSNPFRYLDRYPLDEDVVEKMVKDIINDGLWYPLHAREQAGVIQLAFGHHRLEALKRVGSYLFYKDNSGEPVKYKNVVPLKVRPHSDEQMYWKMVMENFSSNQTPGHLLEIVKGAKSLINTHLQGFENFEDFNADRCDLSQRLRKKGFLADQRGLTVTLKQGAGRGLIFAYLGEDWEKLRKSHVEEGLIADRVTEAHELSERAYVEFKAHAHARKFRQQVLPEAKAVGKRPPVPYAAQFPLASRIIKKAKAENRDIMGVIKTEVDAYHKAHTPEVLDPVLSKEEVLAGLLTAANDANENARVANQNVIDYLDTENMQVTSVNTAFDFFLNVSMLGEVITDLASRMPKGNTGTLKLIHNKGGDR